jgi:septal ring-binding cell division protein DamX
MNTERVDSETVTDKEPTNGSTQQSTERSSILAAMSGTADNKQQEDASTSSESNTVDDSSATEKTDDDIGAKLIKLDEAAEVSTGSDINNKINTLDLDLAKLRAELAIINDSVEEGLDRLSDTDTDLTAKVSETYKRLGEIDNAYKSLLDISSRIDTDIQRLNGDVSSVAKESATGIKNLEQSTIEQSNAFAEKNEQVASRVNQLVETSKLTNDLLNEKIQSATSSMLQIEQKVIAEIESLSSTTQEKTESLDNAVESNRAKILKLQSIDEAIIRRATTLEITSAELTVKSKQLDESVDDLQTNSEVLGRGVEELRQHTHDLEQKINTHGKLIGGLQKASTGIAANVAALADREKRHFNMVGLGFVLLLIVTAALYFTQQNQFGVNDSRYAERSEKVDNQIAELQQGQSSAKVSTEDALTLLETKIDAMNQSIQEDVKKEIAQMSRAVQDTQDQVQSVEGRFNQVSSFSHIGDDNTIHSKQHINEVPAQNYTVQVAYVDNKDSMYAIAQRYNDYMKDKLYYFEVPVESSGTVKTKYVLLSGNYTSNQQAVAASQVMPTYIERQRPVIRQFETVQAFINK